MAWLQKALLNHRICHQTWISKNLNVHTTVLMPVHVAGCQHLSGSVPPWLAGTTGCSSARLNLCPRTRVRFRLALWLTASLCPHRAAQAWMLFLGHSGGSLAEELACTPQLITECFDHSREKLDYAWKSAAKDMCQTAHKGTAGRSGVKCPSKAQTLLEETCSLFCLDCALSKPRKSK